MFNVTLLRYRRLDWHYQREGWRGATRPMTAATERWRWRTVAGLRPGFVGPSVTADGVRTGFGLRMPSPPTDRARRSLTVSIPPSLCLSLTLKAGEALVRLQSRLCLTAYSRRSVYTRWRDAAAAAAAAADAAAVVWVCLSVRLCTRPSICWLRGPRAVCQRQKRDA